VGFYGLVFGWSWLVGLVGVFGGGLALIIGFFYGGLGWGGCLFWLGLCDEVLGV
jgi:hypothetical protein